MASISFKNISKTYTGDVKVVDDFNLEIQNEEFVVFIGPSGCGKTTLLRMIAGLEDITGGTIRIDGKVVNDIEPKDRDIAMVFQSYALYPHMSVFDNMAFGLKMRKIDKDTIFKRVHEVAEKLGIKELLTRKPKQLSGGQRQRVALGRAIVRKPKVFLMDEPLSNLDAKLRVRTRAEIVKLHKELGTTFVYVTHDHTEAMTMGDKIVVIDRGKIQQSGTPTELYKTPVNTFVASFIGSPQINFLKVQTGMELESGRLSVNSSEYSLYLPHEKSSRSAGAGYLSREVVIGIRPENVRVMGDAEEKGFDFEYGTNYKPFFKGTVEAVEYIGSEKYVYASCEDQKMTARVSFDYEVGSGQEILLGLDIDNILIFDKDTENSII